MNLKGGEEMKFFLKLILILVLSMLLLSGCIVMKPVETPEPKVVVVEKEVVKYVEIPRVCPTCPVCPKCPTYYPYYPYNIYRPYTPYVPPVQNVPVYCPYCTKYFYGTHICPNR